MRKRGIDRRVARTKGLLQEAFVALQQARGYDAITIDEICKAANVGRSTFYAHYAGKDDLKRKGLNDHLRASLSKREREGPGVPADTEDRPFAFSLTLLEHARAKSDLYRALVGGRGGIIALGAIRQMLSDLVREELAAMADDRSEDTPPIEFAVHYFVGAYMAVLTWWLDGGAKLSPGRVDAIFRELATNGVLPPRAQR